VSKFCRDFKIDNAESFLHFQNWWLKNYIFHAK